MESESAQQLAEQVLAQIEAALFIARERGAEPDVIRELEEVHRVLHRDGLANRSQESLF